jgi:hypothetical protein
MGPDTTHLCSLFLLVHPGSVAPWAGHPRASPSPPHPASALATERGVCTHDAGGWRGRRAGVWTRQGAGAGTTAALLGGALRHSKGVMRWLRAAGQAVLHHDDGVALVAATVPSDSPLSASWM